MAWLPVAAIAGSVQSAGSKPAGLVALGAMACTTRSHRVRRNNVLRVLSKPSAYPYFALRHYYVGLQSLWQDDSQRGTIPFFI